MAVEGAGGLSPVEAFALVGMVGVGAQWLAWKFRLPGIVVMLAAGLILGPFTGIFIPERDIGDLVGPMISLAVAVILFEGGLTLNFKQLADAAPGVRRLVFIGAPLGWFLSSLALAYIAGLSWQSAIVFGGVMIVTGPTVIAPLLRTAKLFNRPAQLLQWEGIVNDAVGALVAVIALEVVLVRQQELSAGEAVWTVASGVVFATLVGFAGAVGIVKAFQRSLVPEYMKVPLLFVVVIAAFAVSDMVLHESGLLAVTVMGLVIANADLPSYTEIYRFKEQATTLLLSGVFILLAAGVNLEMLSLLNWRSALFILAVILLVRPATVLASLSWTSIPWKERLLVAFTGPRGVVLLAISGIFAERLVAEGIEDGAVLQPLAFVLVLTTVILHGFGLKPLANRLGLSSGEQPGLIIVGGSAFSTGLATALGNADVKVLVTDPNRGMLRSARQAGVPIYYGDILSEAAEHGVEFITYSTILAASDNDAYNTLVATDLAPEFGRDSIWQISRAKEDRARHSLPSQLGGQGVNGGRTLAQYLELLADGWIFRTTRLTEEYTYADWKEAREGAIPLAIVEESEVRFVGRDEEPEGRPGMRIISMIPPEIAEKIRRESDEVSKERELAREEAKAVRKGAGSGSLREDDSSDPVDASDDEVLGEDGHDPATEHDANGGDGAAGRPAADDHSDAFRHDSGAYYGGTENPGPDAGAEDGPGKG
ncbi:cation:proton antiporter domain-containing protein [Paracoccus sediminicola]|uniref:cation:proton antiporter domain-containing protein n=1 Tax=Paracoccus sediminicola TaxID=3017783 RepID=UPI0022F00755|nr:cation:proton antiporter [Paracoccus sediminicola]WBU57568.1 cation:proton antiporter [Paracoccus sediminicola]